MIYRCYELFKLIFSSPNITVCLSENGFYDIFNAQVNKTNSFLSLLSTIYKIEYKYPVQSKEYAKNKF